MSATRMAGHGRPGRVTRKILLAACLAPGLVTAQTVTLRGRIVSESGMPVREASATVAVIGVVVHADTLGRFSVAGTAGSTLKLLFRAAGFRPDSASVALPRSGSVDREFVLQRDEDDRAPVANPSSGVLGGVVLDATGLPLSYPNYQVNGGKRLLADDSGRFQFPAPDGAFTLLVRRIGFEPAEIRLPVRPDTALRIVLTAIPHQLKGVVVSGASAFRSLDIHDFYGRMKDAERGINHGYFVTPEDIERRKPNWISQMADGLPTVRIRRGVRPQADVLISTNGCTMTVYLDGVRIVGRLNGRDDYINEMVSPGSVAAMEVYPRSVTAPPKYQSLNGSCGVVLIWTK